MSRHCSQLLAAAALAAIALHPFPALARQTPPTPNLGAIAAFQESSLAGVVERFTEDLGALERRWGDIPWSAARQARMDDFLAGWAAELETLEVAPEDLEGRIDLALLSSEVRYRRELLAREERTVADVLPLLPFADEIVALLDIRHFRREVAGDEIAGRLADLARAVSEADRAAKSRAAAGGAGEGGGGQSTPTPITGLRAVRLLSSYQSALRSWYRHYAGYDPIFGWWAEQPFGEVDAALGGYLGTLRERIVGWPEGAEEPIVGNPIGPEGMKADLARAMIPYTPAELIEIAEREFAWCEAEMLRASREMGYGDDWRAALEHVKTLHVEPGRQPELVIELAEEAIDFVEARDLVTIPPLAKEVWRLEMMSPERQRVSPFFLGGEVIRVSFPTDEMTHDEKRMSMRGNNIHFSRATVHHELIPGHHLQGFMTDRYNSHRNLGWSYFVGQSEGKVKVDPDWV